MKIDVERTIVAVVQNHTNEPAEEAGYIAYDIMLALGLPAEIEKK